MFAIVAKMNRSSSGFHHSNNIYLANISYEGPPKSFRPDEEMYSVLVIFGIVSMNLSTVCPSGKEIRKIVSVVLKVGHATSENSR
jgi:hypothetical protein